MEREKTLHVTLLFNVTDVGLFIRHIDIEKKRILV